MLNYQRVFNIILIYRCSPNLQVTRTSNVASGANSPSSLRHGHGNEKTMVEFQRLPSGKHTKNYGKSPFLMGKSTISMVIFNSYVKLPEGNKDTKMVNFPEINMCNICELIIWKHIWKWWLICVFVVSTWDLSTNLWQLEGEKWWSTRKCNCNSNFHWAGLKGNFAHKLGDLRKSWTSY